MNPRLAEVAHPRLTPLALFIVALEAMTIRYMSSVGPPMASLPFLGIVGLPRQAIEVICMVAAAAARHVVFLPFQVLRPLITVMCGISSSSSNL